MVSQRIRFVCRGFVGDFCTGECQISFSTIKVMRLFRRE